MVGKLINAIGSFLVSNDWFTIKLLSYKNSSIRVVYYHMVSEVEVPHYFANKAINRTVFIEQLSFFKNHFQIVSIEEAMLSIDNNENRKNLLVISFDDGFRENFTKIYPLLNKNNIKATFFIISNCIDNKDLMWRNKLLLIEKNNKEIVHIGVTKTIEHFNLPELKSKDSLLSWSLNNWRMSQKEDIVNFLWDQTMTFSLEEYMNLNTPYMTSDEIHELSVNGHKIGSHSVSHPVFSKLDFSEFTEEISVSSKCIEKIIKKDINIFSYPFGRTASNDFEKNYITNINNKLLFFGTKNNLNNSNLNIRWERDNTEYNINVMLFRFALLPIFRSLKK